MGPIVLLDAVKAIDSAPVYPTVERSVRIQQHPSVDEYCAAVFFHQFCAITAVYCTVVALP